MKYWQNTIFTSSVQSVWFATSLVWSVQLASKCFMINKTLFFHFFSSKYGIYKFKTCLAIIFVFMIVLICSSRQFRLLSVKLMNIENHFFTRRQKAHFFIHTVHGQTLVLLQACKSGAPNENIVQNHLNTALLNVF